jgi:hypothetical protein
VSATVTWTTEQLDGFIAALRAPGEPVDPVTDFLNAMAASAQFAPSERVAHDQIMTVCRTLGPLAEHLRRAGETK